MGPTVFNTDEGGSAVLAGSIPVRLRMKQLDISMEIGAKRVFACAVGWPGWCRSGKTEDAAIQALLAYAPRYAPVAAAVGDKLPSVGEGVVNVVERVTGDATTDFGAPHKVTDTDRTPLAANEPERLACYYEASWALLESVAAGSPQGLRKGPRGGGRDRDKVVQHTLNAERAYASKLGLKLKAPDLADREAVLGFRAAISQAIRAGAPGTDPVKGWPLRYAVRRIVWHVMDHAWEIEDRRT